MPNSKDQNQEQRNFNQLNNILGHVSKSDEKHAQDIGEKHRINPHQNNIINRYLAFCLVKLMMKSTKTFKYLNDDTKQDLTARACNSNQFAFLKSLESIHFIKKINSTDSLKITTTKVAITSLGKAYIKKYIPHYKRIYKYLEQGTSSMKNSQHNYGDPKLLDIIILDIITFVNITICTNSTPSNLMWILIMLPFVLYLITHYKAIRFKFYCKENITKDIEKATRKSFVNFLKQHNIKEPNYRFGYNNNLPKISYYLFDNKET